MESVNGVVDEHIDITRGEDLETTLALFARSTTHDVFSPNAGDVPSRVVPFYRVEAASRWAGSQESCFLIGSRPVHSQH